MNGSALKNARIPEGLKELPTAFPRRRFEAVSNGPDEFLQGIGSDPFVGPSPGWPGLRVPATPTATLGNITGSLPATKLRYLFMLAAFTIPEGAQARIVGVRTSWTLGAVQGAPAAPRLIEQVVQNPFFRLPDGNVSFHLRQSALSGETDPSGNAQGVITVDPTVLGPRPAALPGLAFRNSRTPAMLFQAVNYNVIPAFYATGINQYAPPNGGQPYGRPISSGMGTFQDLRMMYNNGNAWGDTDVPVVGPATIQLFASVRQSNPATRPAVTLPLANYYSQGLSVEEAFLLNFPTAVIWRLAGSLMVELEDTR